jgi:two-component system LytT family sensor kinase
LRASKGYLSQNAGKVFSLAGTELTPIFTYRKLITAYAVWCLAWIILQALALIFTFDLSWNIAMADSLVTNLLIAICGYVMISMMRFYQPRQVIRLGLSVGLVILSVIAMSYIMPFLIVDPAYADFLKQSLYVRGLYSWLMITLVSTLTWLWFSVREQHEADNRNMATEKLAREAELSRLRQQLQPHFLFNSLNSISALAGSKPEEARKMIHQLSDFFRGTLKKDDQQLVTMSEELEHLTLYLDIEKVRFGHRLKTTIQCEESALSLRLPSLLLQPVVENAIKFGLYDTIGETNIGLTAVSENSNLKISVDNPFDPSTAPPRRGTGFGLNSIQRRLYLLYARNDLLTTAQTENRFTTTVTIPQNA